MKGFRKSDLVPTELLHCICSANKSPCDLCCGELCLLDQGIRAVLTPKRNELAVAMALDGCIFKDQKLKCDGLFVLARPGLVDILLVELKASDINHAFEQLCYVVNHRQEYSDIVSHLSIDGPVKGRVRQKCFIVTTVFVTPTVQEQLEKAYGIRAIVLTVEKPHSAAPDLRTRL